MLTTKRAGDPGDPVHPDDVDIPDTPAVADPRVTTARVQDFTHAQDFTKLCERLRGFVYPMIIFFLGWYFLYILLAVFMPGFLSIRVFDNINVDLIFGLLQFVSTLVITIAYVRFANQRLDPVGNRIRQRIKRTVR